MNELRLAPLINLIKDHSISEGTEASLSTSTCSINCILSRPATTALSPSSFLNQQKLLKEQKQLLQLRLAIYRDVSGASSSINSIPTKRPPLLSSIKLDVSAGIPVSNPIVPLLIGNHPFVTETNPSQIASCFT